MGADARLLALHATGNCWAACACLQWRAPACNGNASQLARRGCRPVQGQQGGKAATHLGLASQLGWPPCLRSWAQQNSHEHQMSRWACSRPQLACWQRAQLHHLQPCPQSFPQGFPQTCQGSTPSAVACPKHGALHRGSIRVRAGYFT